MTLENIQEAFALLQYQRDERSPPDERRRGQFRAGWADATMRGRVYSGDTMTRLTWHNLGYRLGKHFGDQTPEQINEVFDVLAGLYRPSPVDDSGPNAAPSPQQYVDAFRRVGNISGSQTQMLRLHYHEPARTITAAQMARALDYDHYSIVNLQYGQLGRMVGDQLEFNPMKERLGTLVTFEKRQDEWHWLMRPEVAQALELLGWVETTDLLFPEEIAPTTALVEGAVCRVLVNAYERNREARRRCIERYGPSCCICGFNFGDVYGDVVEGCIQVHHLRPLSEVGGEYIVDPVADLRPVCPNCHAVLHSRRPAYSIEDIQAFLSKMAEK